ncbi:MAG: muconate cycloisomerase [Kribbellaceae bacterium]|nr:muconate cycloisomerase [Kribbellaceae bacterium]
MSKIRSVEVFPVAVPFARQFVLGSGAVGSPDQAPDQAAAVVFVKLTTEDGVVGWGEQRALPSWSYETAETIAVVIKRHLEPILLELTPFDIELFHQRVTKRLSPSVSNGFPFARAAVDLAMHDAAGKLAGVPVHALLGGKLHDEIPLCSAIGVGAPDVVREHARQSSDYSAYKVKIGGDLDSDAAAIETVAEVAGAKPLWLDANQSYRPSALKQLLDRTSHVRTIHCVEQPVPSTDTLAMHRLRELIDLPIAIDEGSFTAQDLARAIRLDAADLVVVKICKAGGLRNALKTAQVALSAGIEILASGLTDCGIGFAAALHLFSQLELALPAELNGPELLSDLYVEGLTITKAVATVPTAPGLGVQVDEERIRAESITLLFT